MTALVRPTARSLTKVCISYYFILFLIRITYFSQLGCELIYCFVLLLLLAVVAVIDFVVFKYRSTEASLINY